jgi:hypothetical protein
VSSSHLSVRRRATAPLLVLGALATGVACGDNNPVAPSFHIAVAGYVERSGTATFTLLNHGTIIPDSALVWTASPANVATIDNSGQAHFADTGAVTITARLRTASTTLALHVGPPPTIVFDLQDSGGIGDRDVYRMALDGRALQRLTSPVADNEQPTIADSIVVFTSYRTGSPSLFQVPLAGGSETALTSPVPASQGSLSRDGTHLAFIAPKTGFDHVWTSAANGSGATMVNGGTGYATALQETPSWGPSGDTLVFVTTQYGNPALARLAVASGVETQLTDGSSTDLSPAWSGDGHTIAFASTRDGALGVYLLTLATGAIQRATALTDTTGEPTWLPDGRLVYTSTVNGVTTLRWLDPTHPDSGHAIPTPAGGNPHRPVGVY